MRKWALLVAVSIVAIALVARRALRDAGDPARCGSLVPAGARCCAPGQREIAGRCAGDAASCPAPLVRDGGACVAPRETIAIAGGRLRAGAGDWEAEGRVAPHDADVASFRFDRFEATERDWTTCVRAGACAAVPLRGEPGLPATGMSRAEAAAYCAFVRGRLPTEDEWTWAAGGAKPRRYPWGDTGAVCRRGVWGTTDGPCALGAGPELVGSHPDGATPEGALDLAGDAAEWVAGPPIGPAYARGGSFRDALATDLRTWQHRELAADARRDDVGVRCAYDP